MQRAGVVLSVEGNIAIVLTRDGEFCEVPCTPNVAVGSEIEWDTSAITRLPARKTHARFSLSRFSFRWRNLAFSGAAAVVAIAAGIWYYGVQNAYAATPYAYVAVEINPDISLVVNKKMRVLEANALNSDGAALLRTLHLKDDSLKDALRQIIDASVEQHMLPAADNIIVTAAPAQANTDMKAVQEQVKKDITDAVVENAKAKELAPKVYTIRVSKTVWKAANGAHIPPAQLAAYLIAKKRHIPLSVSDAQGDVTRRVLDQAQDDDGATTDDVAQVQNVIRELPEVVKKMTPQAHMLNIAQPVPHPDSAGGKEKQRGHSGDVSDSKAKDGSDSGKGHRDGKDKEHSDKEQRNDGQVSHAEGDGKGNENDRERGSSTQRFTGPAPVNTAFSNALGRDSFSLTGNFSPSTSPFQLYPPGSASVPNPDKHDAKGHGKVTHDESGSKRDANEGNKGKKDHQSGQDEHHDERHPSRP